MAPERRFYLRRSAEADIVGAASWYGGKHAGLDLEFVAEVDRAFAQIREAPERWPL